MNSILLNSPSQEGLSAIPQADSVIPQLGFLKGIWYSFGCLKYCSDNLLELF